MNVYVTISFIYCVKCYRESILECYILHLTFLTIKVKSLSNVANSLLLSHVSSILFIFTI